MTLLALLGLLLAALYAGMTFANLRLYREPPAPSGRPAVSILIPMRDEAANVAPLLACVLGSRGVELEVVVLDDGSTDGTSDLVRAVADPRLRLLPGAPLPPGWIGKPHACHQLGLAARHDLLLFLDADVRLRPDAVSRLAAFVEAGNLGLASGFPRLPALTTAERLTVPMILVLLLGYLPFGLARANPTDPRFAAACGQALMARREAYVAAGGHAALARTMHDGIGLARGVRRAGFATDLCDLSRLAACRMYETAPQVWRGFLKNAREGMATPRGLPVWTLLLFGGHVLPILTLLGGSVAPSAAALLLLAGARVALARRVGQDAPSVLLHPLAVLATLLIQWTALLGGPRRAPAVWRGRTYGA